MKALLIAAASLLLTVLPAGEVFRNASGRTSGTSTTHGNRTVYRDASGRTAGTATTHGNRTVLI